MDTIIEIFIVNIPNWFRSHRWAGWLILGVCFALTLPWRKILRAMRGMPPSAADLIIALENENNSFKRQTIIQSLGKLRDHSAIGPLSIALVSDPNNVEEISAALKAIDNNWRSYRGIGDALSRQVDALLIALNQNLCEPFPVIRLLGAIGDPKATDALVRRLGDATTSDYGASDALVRIGSPAVGHLINELNNPNSRSSEKVIAVLERIGDRKSIDALVTKLRGYNSDYLRNRLIVALEALGKLPQEEKDRIESLKSTPVLPAPAVIPETSTIPKLVRLAMNKEYPETQIGQIKAILMSEATAATKEELEAVLELPDSLKWGSGSFRVHAVTKEEFLEMWEETTDCKQIKMIARGVLAARKR